MQRIFVWSVLVVAVGCGQQGTSRPAELAPTPTTTVAAPESAASEAAASPAQDLSVPEIEQLLGDDSAQKPHLPRLVASELPAVYERYRERVVAVRGSVRVIQKLDTGAAYLVMDGVLAMFHADDVVELAALQRGQFATIAGTVTGEKMSDGAILLQDSFVMPE